jgi:hypothetical protein
VQSLWPREDGSAWSGKSSNDIRDSQLLATLVRPVRPKTIRFKDGAAKGYSRRRLEKALGIASLARR